MTPPEGIGNPGVLLSILFLGALLVFSHTSVQVADGTFQTNPNAIALEATATSQSLPIMSISSDQMLQLQLRLQMMKIFGKCLHLGRTQQF